MCLVASAIHHWAQCTYTDATGNGTPLATLKKRRRLGQTCSDTSTEFVDNQILQIQHQLEDLRSRLSEPATSANESNNVLGIPFSASEESNAEIHLNSALGHGNR